MAASQKKIDDELAGLIALVKISEGITPVNDSSERKKFLEKYAEGAVYNPQYRYRKNKKKLGTAKEGFLELKKTMKDRDYLGVIDKMLSVIDYLESIGDDTKQIFPSGTPDPQMVAVAKLSIPKEKGKIQERTIPAREAKMMFLEHIKSYGIKDWKVKVSKRIIAKTKVESADRTLYIKNRKYSFHEITNFISHEVDVHILRAVNGQTQKNTLFALGTKDYLKTEEGLAIMMEQLSGNYNAQRFRFFAARIIACDLALTKSFYEVFDSLVKNYNLSKHNAYVITKRVKRGLCDTSLPGGYIKDHVYFEGFMMIKKYMQGGGDIRPLFAGKIALADAHLLEKANNKKNIILPKALDAHYQYRSKQKVLY